MRPPSLNLATLTRGLGKVRQWLLPRKPVSENPANPRVHNPRMWPWFRTRFDRWVNARLLRRQLLRALRDFDRPPVAVTTIPIVADLMHKLPVRGWVYYCVDDFSKWPGVDQSAMERMERGLVACADRVLAVSETLQERLAGMGRSSELLTHGVDLPFWQRQDAAPVTGVEGLARPLVLFWGLIDQRLDIAFVRHLAEKLTHGTVVLVGPQAAPDPALFSLPRVTVLPPVAFEQLPWLAKQAAVLVMPYADLPVTRAMQPLKLKEYLATGLPVVVRDLPANRSWADAMDLASNPGEFSAAVLQRLQNGLPPDQSTARRRLALESWDAKVAVLERLIEEVAESRNSAPTVPSLESCCSAGSPS
jgi:glycosyltransferase involved in cell wall biosynthesis